MGVNWRQQLHSVIVCIGISTVKRRAPMQIILAIEWNAHTWLTRTRYPTNTVTIHDLTTFIVPFSELWPFDLEIFLWSISDPHILLTHPSNTNDLNSKVSKYLTVLYLQTSHVHDLIYKRLSRSCNIVTFCDLDLTWHFSKGCSISPTLYIKFLPQSGFSK